MKKPKKGGFQTKLNSISKSIRYDIYVMYMPPSYVDNTPTV